ncbi:mucin-17-like [Haliotis rubra]|uniref:mucin-17-like n=1 Tax=Haliotis rubra TaxID=36100 RepID=UPI001EE60290|nr:mucin-17-like [Haliotis rubra]
MTSGTGSPGQVPFKRKRRIKPIPCKPVTSALPVFSSPVMHPLSPAQTPEPCSPAPSTHLQVSSPCVPPVPHGQSGLMSPPLSVSAHRSRTPSHVPQQSSSPCMESRGRGMSSSPPQSPSIRQSPGTQVVPSQDLQHYQPTESPFQSPQYQADPSLMSPQGIHPGTPAPCVDPITSPPTSQPCVASPAPTTVLHSSFQTSQPLHQNGTISQTPSLDPTVSCVKIQPQTVVSSIQQVTSFPENGVHINIEENGVIKTYSMDETNRGQQLLPTNGLPKVAVINSCPPNAVPSSVISNTSFCPRPVTVNPLLSTSVLTMTTSNNILNSIAPCPSTIYVTQPVMTPSSVVHTKSSTSQPQSSESPLVSSVLVPQSSTVNHQSSGVQPQSSILLAKSSGSVQPESSEAPSMSSVIMPEFSEALSQSLSVPTQSMSAYSPSTMEDSLHTVTALPGSILTVRPHSPSPTLTVGPGPVDIRPCPQSQGSLPTAISSALLCTNSQMSFDLLEENTLSDFVLPVKPAEDQVQTVVLTDTNVSLPTVVVNDQIYDLTMSPNGKQLILKNPRPISDSQTSSYQPVTVVPSSIPQIRSKMTPVKLGSQNTVVTVSPKLPATSPRLSKLQEIVKQSVSPKFKTSCKPNILSKSPRQTKTVSLPCDGYFVSPNQEKTETVLNSSETIADDQYIAIPLGRLVEESHKRSLSFDKRAPTDSISNAKPEPPKEKPMSKSSSCKRPIKAKIKMGDRRRYPKVNGVSVMNVEVGCPTGKSSCIMSLMTGDKPARHKLKTKKKVTNAKPDKEQTSLTKGTVSGSSAVKQPPRSKAKNLSQANEGG